MQRQYLADSPVNILYPSISIKKGDIIILDTEMNKMVRYFVTYLKDKKEPIKFEISSTTWQKLADRSKNV